MLRMFFEHLKTNPDQGKSLEPLKTITMRYHLTLDTLEPIEENRVTIKELAEFEIRMIKRFQEFKEELKDL